MWRSTDRASLEKKPSMRLSHDPCVGVNVKVKRPMGCAASQLVVSRETWAEWLSRMTSIAVSAASRSLRKLDEFAAAVAFLDEGMDVTGEQIDPGHQGQRAVALVLVIAHHGRAGAGQWRAIRRGRTDCLDAGLLVARDDGEAVATAIVLTPALLPFRPQHCPLPVAKTGSEVRSSRESAGAQDLRANAIPALVSPRLMPPLQP